MRTQLRWGAAGLVLTLLASLAGFACSDDPASIPVADAAAPRPDAPDVGVEPTDAGPDTSFFSAEARALLMALGDSVWNGSGVRKGKTRAIELRFRASSLQWAEIQNPYGPARKRELRSFYIENDGASVIATANTPLAWPDRTDEMGRQEFKVVIKAGSPRTLEVTRNGVTERYTEGATPRPTNGLTASVRAFGSGPIEDAFCTSGAGGFDYTTIYNFARGRAGTPLGEDLVAGAKLNAWVDNTGQNRFSVTDVDGFRNEGGTNLSDTFNFFVRYTGFVVHPGGDLVMRERDDTVEDGLWAFLGPQVNSLNVNDLFLEVHGFVFADKTPDAPRRTLPAGKVPVEIILVRCAKPISPVHVELAFGAGAFSLVGAAPTEPEINNTLFPPAL